MTRALEVVEAGVLTTMQDLGRPGLKHLGVPRSGAADRASLKLANRLVGNAEGAVALETTLGGLAVRAHGSLSIALTGAPVPARHNTKEVGPNSVLRLRAGDLLELGRPRVGLRTYVAIGGGLEPQRVLGSGATDVLSGLGPLPVQQGDVLMVGPTPSTMSEVDQAPVAPPAAGLLELPLTLGPRDDWLTDEARAQLLRSDWTVTPTSNRIGLRLTGERLRLRHDHALPSEGMTLGALQVPPQGQPILFLADHPVTGGYPVVGVVDDEAMDAAGQAVPGQMIRFVVSRRTSVRPRDRLR